METLPMDPWTASRLKSIPVRSFLSPKTKYSSRFPRDARHISCHKSPSVLTVFSHSSAPHVPVLFFSPDLTVDQTLKFALKMKTPSKQARPEGLTRQEWEASYRDTMLKTFGIEHTVDTKVGNESVRGVSGGERKVRRKRIRVPSWQTSGKRLG